jgi:hypothetical protein
VKSGKGWPKTVSLASQALRARRPKVGGKLGAAGIVFKEYNELGRTRAAPWQRNFSGATTARGLPGIGLPIVDVGANFVHLGDAISGGGTVASIAIQAVAQAVCHRGRLVQRKMQQLNEKIAKNGDLPPDERLREEFDLDDDDIQNLKDKYQSRMTSATRY